MVKIHRVQNIAPSRRGWSLRIPSMDARGLRKSWRAFILAWVNERVSMFGNGICLWKAGLVELVAVVRLGYVDQIVTPGFSGGQLIALLDVKS